MTDTLEQMGRAETPPSRRSRLVMVAALVVVVALLVGVWVLVAAQQRSQVAVWFDGQPLECLGPSPTVEDLGADIDPLYVQVLDVTTDLNCWLRVQVENRGRLAATVRGVVLPMHGPGTGAGIRARELSPLALPPAIQDETGWPALDAVYTFDYPVAPGDRVVLRIGLEHQPDGCMSPDSWAWVRDAPSVTVSVLGLRGTRAPTGVAFAQRGTADSSCDVP